MHDLALEKSGLGMKYERDETKKIKIKKRRALKERTDSFLVLGSIDDRKRRCLRWFDWHYPNGRVFGRHQIPLKQPCRMVSWNMIW